jgi:hypothetical protein
VESFFVSLEFTDSLFVQALYPSSDIETSSPVDKIGAVKGVIPANFPSISICAPVGEELNSIKPQSGSRST